MPRAAGDSNFYELAIIDGAGNPKGRSTYLPSSSTIVKALHKGGLDWWGHKIGVEGALHWVLRKHEEGVIPDEVTKELVEKVYEEIKKEKVHTPNAVMKSAGSRGTDVHDLAERLLKGNSLPPLNRIPVEKQGYAKALWDWYQEVKDYEVIAIEEPVYALDAPPTHTYEGYAGTFDALLRQDMGDDQSLYHLVDFKTSKSIYESHLLQTTSYVHAALERKWIPRDAFVMGTVIRLGADGTWEARHSNCSIEDFWTCKRMWEWLEEMKDERKVVK